MKARVFKSIFVFLLAVGLTLGIIVATEGNVAQAAPVIAPDTTAAESVFVGGVELQKDQYVMNGSSTVVDGTPADDANGFAWYSDAGLLLVNYVYEGQGHIYDGDNYAVISSTGNLVIQILGMNELVQTEEYGTGIYAGGDLVIGGFGGQAGYLEVSASFALYADSSLYIESDVKGIKINSDYVAMTAYDLIAFLGGDVDVTTYYPIKLNSTAASAEIVIADGTVEVKSETGAFAIAPYRDNYNATDKVVELRLSENTDGSDFITTGDTIDLENFSKYKYFFFGEKVVEREIIENILVRNVEKPQIGESFNDWPVTPDTLFYDGEYKMVGCSFEKFDGTEWVDYSGADDLVEAGVMYRLSIVLAPNDGYDFSTEITRENVQIDYGPGEVEKIMEVGDVHYAVIYLNVQYANPDFGITVAVNDGDEVLGVKINEDNCDDVLGDGTLSYDPETSTLTLNNYVYVGVGYEDDGSGAFLIDVPEDGMTINLVGNNRILVSNSFGAGFAFFGDGSVTIKGSGSLEMQAGMYGFMTMGSDALIMDGGNISIETTGVPSAGLAINSFTMNGGSLKIKSAFIGIIVMNSANNVRINGGDLEISAVNAGNHVAYATGEMEFASKAIDLAGYTGEYTMTASVNRDGSDAVNYNPADISTYKYIKVLHGHKDSNSDEKCDVCGIDMSIGEGGNGGNGEGGNTGNTGNGEGGEGGSIKEPVKEGLTGGEIAGIVIGSVAGVALLGCGGFAIFWFVVKKKTWAEFVALFKKN